MSGGSYDYAYTRVNDFYWELGTRPMTPHRAALAEVLKKVSEAMRMVEWVDSGDCVDGDENESIEAVMREAARQASSIRRLTPTAA